MDTQVIVLILILLDLVCATPAIVDILVLVVLIDTVSVVATGVELSPFAKRVSTEL